VSGVVERIYVRIPNWVGDVVLATPFFAALRAAYPRAEIVAHGKARLFDITEGARFFDRVVPLERRLGPLWPIVEGRRLRSIVGEIDLAFLLPNSLSAALIAWTAGARRRLGYALDGRSVLLTDALPVKKEGRLRPIPMVDYYLALLAAAGQDTSRVKRCPALPVTEPARERVERLLERQGIAGHERIWALNAGAVWETKRWIPEYLGELCDMVHARGAVPFVLRGPGEEEIVERARRASKRGFKGGDELVPLGDLVAFLARCCVLVTTDSGPRHLGVAAGIPVVALIGSTHPAYTVVDHRALKVLCEEVDCWPCHLEKCPVDFRCMTRLVPAKVATACDELLDREPAP
jgi:heptosyltransferase-2